MRRTPCRRSFLLAVLAALVAACGGASDRTLVLDYRDFGPQAAAWEVLGMEWWQWEEASGHAEPGRRYEIRVVVYRDLSPEAVARRYPVIPEEERDYRYLAYGDAMDYLNGRIREDTVLRPLLARTRTRILAALGAPEMGPAEREGQE